MLVTLMTAFITYYLYLWTVATCTDEDVINIEILSPTWSHQHTLVRNSFLTCTCISQREVVAFWINIGDIKIKFCWHCPPTNEYFPYPVLSIIINRSYEKETSICHIKTGKNWFKCAHKDRFDWWTSNPRLNEFEKSDFFIGGWRVQIGLDNK